MAWANEPNCWVQEFELLSDLLTVFTQAELASIRLALDTAKADAALAREGMLQAKGRLDGELMIMNTVNLPAAEQEIASLTQQVGWMISIPRKVTMISLEALQ